MIIGKIRNNQISIRHSFTEEEMKDVDYGNNEFISRHIANLRNEVISKHPNHRIKLYKLNFFDHGTQIGTIFDIEEIK